MRNQTLSLLLIFTFLFGSLPAVNAQETLSFEPETPVVEEIVIEETPTVVLENEPEVQVLEETETTEDADTSEVPIIESLPATEVSEVSQPLEVVEELTEEVLSLEAATTTPTTTPVVASSTPSFQIDGHITLPNGCDVTDTANVTHIFPIATSTEYLAICALLTAEADGIITDFEVTDSSFGLSVASINDVAPGATEYWSLLINNDYAQCGVECLSLNAGDTLTFVLTDWMTNATSSSVMLHVDALSDTYNNVIVPSWCTLTDTAGSILRYPKEGAPTYVAVCALTAAVEAGHLTFAVTDSAWGLSVASVNGELPGATEYWSPWLSGEYAQCGVECLEVSTGDTLELVLTDWMTNTESTRVAVRVIGMEEVATTTPPGGGGSGSGTPGTEFEIAAAFDFLESIQNSDGSWDSELVTDWSAVALGVSGAPSSMKSSLSAYLRNEKPGLDSALDYARQAMALMALGINPYTGGELDTITPIVESFDGEQIDEASLVNDDIFALVALINAGYDESDEIIRKSAAFVVAEQRGDGSWVNSPSITAAGIQALTPIDSLPGVSSALNRAESYLRNVQRSDGGFGDQGVSDAFATSWVLQAIEAIGSSPEAWTNNNNTPLDYMATIQKEDGSLMTVPGDDQTRGWATAYAIPAVKGLTWHDILRDFKKPAGTEAPSTGKGSDTETATTSPETEIATSNNPVLVDPLPTMLDVPAVLTAETMLPATVPAPVMDTSLNESVVQEVVTEADEGSVETATATNPLLTASALDSAGGQSLWNGIKSFFASLWQMFVSIF